VCDTGLRSGAVALQLRPAVLDPRTGVARRCFRVALTGPRDQLFTLTRADVYRPVQCGREWLFENTEPRPSHG
jgi:hypothetical protein